MLKKVILLFLIITIFGAVGGGKYYLDQKEEELKQVAIEQVQNASAIPLNLNPMALAFLGKTMGDMTWKSMVEMGAGESLSNYK